MIILGADPGGESGIVIIDFMEFRRGALSWDTAQLVNAFTVGKPSSKYATAAELDVLHRQRIADRITTAVGSRGVDFAAIEEPIDGASFYNAQQQRGQARGTAFRLGVHYAALLHGIQDAARPARVVSFPAKTSHGRRGWMGSSSRTTIMQAAELTLASINAKRAAGKFDIPRDGKGMIVEHVLMAVGVVNHLVEYFGEYFAREMQK